MQRNGRKWPSVVGMSMISTTPFTTGHEVVLSFFQRISVPSAQQLESSEESPDFWFYLTQWLSQTSVVGIITVYNPSLPLPLFFQGTFSWSICQLHVQVLKSDTSFIRHVYKTELARKETLILSLDIVRRNSKLRILVKHIYIYKATANSRQKNKQQRLPNIEEHTHSRTMKSEHR